MRDPAPRPARRLPARRLIAGVAVALAATAGTAVPSDAQASRYLQPGIHDDAQILNGDPEVVFPRLEELNAKVIRVTLWWGGPNGVARRSVPADPTNPDDPAYDWSRYDRVTRYAREFGMQVVFTVLGTPSWANRGLPWNVAPVSAADLKSFVVAAARRYDGTRLVDGHRLAPVKRWVAWNEPNNPVFLKEQYRRVATGWVVQSARDYARICNAVVNGVRIGQKGGKVACGATAPRGNNSPGSTRPSVSPLAFLDAMKRAGARGFTAYAHHPYYGSRHETPATRPKPGPQGQAPTAITLGNLDVLTRRVVALYGRGMRIWVTEYGYQTNPPDLLFGVSWANQARYMREAYLRLRRDARVDMFIWFLLRDETRSGGWESGLYTADWRAKTAHAAFATLLRP
jgi:hypothetical protein